MTKFAGGIYVCVLLLHLCAQTDSDNRGCSSFECFEFSPQNINEESLFWDIPGPIPILEYIRQKGYEVEPHEIQTQDGYILTYHRIPRGKSSNSVSLGKPVLVQHGLLVASSSWVMADNALAFSLADAGFDVWLGNARGNTYSRKNIKYNPDTDKKAFWDFSWHEMGNLDLPASIDYILNATGRERLFYVGHSMGTTMYLVLGATRPEYMAKVQAAVLLAPVAFIWHVRSPVVRFLRDLNPFINMLQVAGVYELPTTSNLSLWFDHNICAHKHLQFLCRELIFSVTGYDNQQLNRTSLPTILEYVPNGGSLKTVEHYNQIEWKGVDFQQFNYGPVGNLQKYGSLLPPVYNLRRARAPVHIYYALNDWIIEPQDVFHVAKKLPNVKSIKKVPDDQFNHLDFMWAIDAKTLVYDDVISTLQSYE